MRALISIPLAFMMTTSIAQNPGADAQKRPVLVELFTSEGCSSCPPADALLAAIDRMQPFSGVTAIVLSEHVDYWDHDGWKDPFSSSDVTARQDVYSRHFGQPSSYTPEAVIDGAQGLNGSDPHTMTAAIEKAGQQEKIAIAITNAVWNGNTAEATVSATAHAKADLYAALADEQDETSVARGENSGKHLQHVAVVRTFEKIGSLKDGFSKPIHVKLRGEAPQKKMRLVIFAQEGDEGRVLGVAEAGLVHD